MYSRETENLRYGTLLHVCKTLPFTLPKDLL